MRMGSLGFASDRTDHPGAEFFGPLARNGADAAGRRVNQNKLSGQNRKHVLEQKAGSNALLQGGCGDGLVNSIRHGNQPVGGDKSGVGVAARTDAGVSHSISGGDRIDIVSDRFDDTGARDTQTGR